MENRSGVVWPETIPARRAAGRIDCDIAVVGGGLVGLTAAHIFSLLAYQVCLFEQDALGGATSRRSCGLVSFHPMDSLHRLSLDLGKTAADEIVGFGHRGGKSFLSFLDRFCPEAVLHRGLIMAGTTKAEAEELARSADGLSKLGISCDYLSSWNENFRAEGYLRIRQGFAFRPDLAGRALAKEAGTRGAVFYEQSRVESVDLSGGGVTLRGKAFSARCEICVVCVNAFLAEVLPRFGSHFYPVRSQFFLSKAEQVPSLPVLANFGHEIYQPYQEGILMGGINPNAGIEEGVWFEPTDPFQDFMEKFYAERIGCPPNVTARGAAPIAYTTTGLPLIGRFPGHHRLFFLAGGGGRGYSFAWSGAEAIGQMLTAGRSDLPRWFSPAQLL